MSRLLLAVLFLGSTQDRADLRLPIDTWYTVLQGTRPVGYVHETLRRGSPPWRYDYGLDAEVELSIRGKSHAEDLAVTAFLDDTLMPVEALFEGHSDEVASAWSLYTLRDERRVELRPGSSPDPVAW